MAGDQSPPGKPEGETQSQEGDYLLGDGSDEKGMQGRWDFGASHNQSLDLGVARTVCSLCDDSSSCALTICALLLCVCYTSIKRKKIRPAIQL